MFLAAGFGKRLRPLTDRLPKALVPVGDCPAIEHALDSIRASLGHIPLVVNAHYKAKMVAEQFHRPSRDVKVVVETEIWAQRVGSGLPCRIFGTGLLLLPMLTYWHHLTTYSF